MVEITARASEISEILDRHFEWLAVFGKDRNVSLRRDEIEIVAEKDRLMLITYGETGQISRRILSFAFEGDEPVLTVSGGFGRETAEIRFIPRESPTALRIQIEHARLERAARIASAVFDADIGGTNTKSISLLSDNGRLARITAGRGSRESLAMIADVTGAVPHQSLLAIAVKMLDAFSERKRQPINELHIAGSRPQMRRLKKLTALLKPGFVERLLLFEIVENGDELTAIPISTAVFGELWRSKVSRKPERQLLKPGKHALEMVAMASEKIDVVHTRSGETLRFHGLPFARVRKMAGVERCWFGISSRRKELNDDTREEFYGLVDELHRRRDKETPEKRHELYRMASEAWIASILARDITRLDANLILSPIYDQFQMSSGKLDLLAMRRNGRLVVIEIKASPDRNAVFQSAEYWQKIELLRRKGVLAEARLFGNRKILDMPPLLYVVAPALSFHHDFDRFATLLRNEIDIWRWELHENWRTEIKAIARKDYR